MVIPRVVLQAAPATDHFFVYLVFLFLLASEWASSVDVSTILGTGPSEDDKHPSFREALLCWGFLTCFSEV